MTKGAGLTRRSYVEEASPGCDTARQSPPGAPSVCAPTLPTSAPPAAARPRPSSPAPLLRERPSGKPRKPGTESTLVIYPKKKKKKSDHFQQEILSPLTCLTWCQASSHCLIFFLASSSSLKRRATSPLLLLAADARLLKTGDGLGEKLPLTKSQMLGPPFKPRDE